MPVKNAGKFLKPCLESIIKQTYTDWELIAVNDHSTDNSKVILNGYSDLYNNVLTIDNYGQGIIDALKSGYKLATGDIVHRMDADDIMTPNKLELLLGVLKPGGIATGKVKYFREDAEVGDGFKTYSTWLNGLWINGDGWNDLYKECPIASPAWLMFKTDFDRIEGFNSEELPEDYDLAFRIYMNGLKVHWVNEVVHLWRDSSSRTSRNNSEYFPSAYYPLKVKYFLTLDRNRNKPLLLWGAGKKGKLVARLLNKRNEDFSWITNNTRKIGAPIYGKKLVLLKDLDPKQYQNIIVVSGPKDKQDLSQLLTEIGLNEREDYFWFC